MANLNKFRSINVLNKSHNKLHGLILCSIIEVNFFEWLPHRCTPHIQLSVRSPSTISTTHTREIFIFSQRRALTGRSVKIKKTDAEYSFQRGEFINYTLDDVSINPVTTKIQVSFLTQLPERKETTQGFHNEANGDFKTVTEFNGYDWRNLRTDQQQCSYSTILT